MEVRLGLVFESLEWTRTFLPGESLDGGTE